MIYAKTDEPGFVKDLISGGLLNTDNVALNTYKAKRRARAEQQQLSTRVDILENKVDRVIKLLEQLLEK